MSEERHAQFVRPNTLPQFQRPSEPTLSESPPLLGNTTDDEPPKTLELAVEESSLSEDTEPSRPARSPRSTHRWRIEMVDEPPF
jgi:hypothetical protein